MVWQYTSIEMLLWDSIKWVVNRRSWKNHLVRGHQVPIRWPGTSKILVAARWYICRDHRRLRPCLKNENGVSAALREPVG
jgi:hypothetical protein